MLFDDERMLPARTLWQPYAGLVELGLKDVEAVKSQTTLRGPLVICAGLQVDERVLQQLRRQLVPRVVSVEAFDLAMSRRGAAVALVEVVGVRRLDLADKDRAFWWDPSDPRWAWLLAKIQPLVRPFAVRGMPGFFPLSKECVQRALQP